MTAETETFEVVAMEERKTALAITDVTRNSSRICDGDQKWSCSGRCFVRFLRRNLLLLLLVASLGVGIVMGTKMKSIDPPLNEREQMYFKFPGELLMRMLKCMIIPLIVSSLISGVASLGTAASGRIGLAAVIYYFVTTATAAILGIILVSTIQPGFRTQESLVVDRSIDEGNVVDSFLDLIRNMFPDNIIEACFRQTRTHQIPVKVVNRTACNTTDLAECNCTYVRYDFDVRKEDSTNVLGLVVFSLAMGVVLTTLGEVGKPLFHLCQALTEATMRLVSIIVWYSPVGVCFLIAAQIVVMQDPMAELASLGFYMLTVLVGLAIHGLIVLPLIYFVVIRRNPFSYLAGIVEALVTGFGICTSAGTLPVTFKCVEENNGIDRRVSRFILPVGATINMDGTALYEAVAAIYIAQVNGLNLNAAQLVTTSITATMASIGAASVPQAGLVTMILVLSAIGLPADQVARILAVDWLLDRFRTIVNIEGDCIGAAIVSHTCRKQLQASYHHEIHAVDVSLDADVKLPQFSPNPSALSGSDGTRSSVDDDIVTESSPFLLAACPPVGHN